MHGLRKGHFADLDERHTERVKRKMTIRGSNWVDPEPPWKWVFRTMTLLARNDYEVNPYYKNQESLIRSRDTY